MMNMKFKEHVQIGEPLAPGKYVSVRVYRISDMRVLVNGIFDAVGAYDMTYQEMLTLLSNSSTPTSIKTIRVNDEGTGYIVEGDYIIDPAHMRQVMLKIGICEIIESEK